MADLNSTLIITLNTGSRMLRYAAIDIGSNAIRLLIADIIEGREGITYKKNTLIRVPLRLGEDAFVKRLISPEREKDLLDSMIAFRKLMDVYQVKDYMACATSAMREAENGPLIAAGIKRIAGIDLKIVDGHTEANIIYSSHFEKKLDSSKNFLYIDVGGGSTELSIFNEGKLVASRSFDLGGIRILDGQDKAETWKDLQDWIKNKANKFKDLRGIGTGGNINKLFKMSGVKDGNPLSYLKLRALAGRLESLSIEERIKDLGLNDDRADVIVPAASIYISVMKWAGIRSIYVPRVGLVDGVIQLLIDKNSR